MRADMDRVLIERPRWGSRLRNEEVRAQRAAWRATVARGDFDHERQRRPMVPRRGWLKGLTDHLSPLKRFLHRRAGRRWDDVHREVCERVKPDSLLQQHVLVHLDQFVARNAWLEPDGTPWSIRNSPHRVWYMYVHPDSGRLSVAPRRSPAGDPPPPTPVRAGPTVFARVPGDDRLWLQLASGWVVVRTADDDGHDALFDRPAADVPLAERVAMYGDATLRAVTCRPVGRRARRARGLP